MSALDNVTLAKIKEGGYEVKDNIYRDKYLHFNRLLAEYNELTDELDKELCYDSMVTLVSEIMFGGRDPKLVSTSIIKRAVANPPSMVDGKADYEARARVRNPNTGIRSMCIKCMGGQPVLVRHCATVTCPLWAFRMGTNPLYGRLQDTDTEAEVVEDYEAEEALEGNSDAD